MVYSREINGQNLTFGISGRLYKSNVLLYDHQTDSLWSQLMSKAIAGPSVRQTLRQLPSQRVSWKQWRHMHPQTRVLSDETGYRRDYTTDPYEGYYRVAGLMFPVGDVRRELSPKTRILGIHIDGNAKGYDLTKLKQKSGPFLDRLGSTQIVIEISPSGEVLGVNRTSGEPVDHVFVFWFAWQAFHPRTDVFKFDASPN